MFWTLVEFERGLSPPTRGSQSSSHERQGNHWSIPAHAGEPHTVAGSLNRASVYPRPRGGASHRGREPQPGSIPAHAGEPRAGGERGDIDGSIPAHAGEPRSACISPVGLSPPTRGSRGRIRVLGIGQRSSSAHQGSIPAHAGEPPLVSRVQSAQRIARVYPRPRGGAPFGWRWRVAEYGLSPPTRGSQARRALRQLRHRSIPAHAGEPGSAFSSSSAAGVYPRPRGGAVTEPSCVTAKRGLSPPTRGSHGGVAQRVNVPGSIPAHAGEPDRWWCGLRCGRVYPAHAGEPPYPCPSS